MSIPITMPRLSDTMQSGTIIKWNVAEGASVSSGDVVADIETDKATMELTSFDDGTLARIVVPEGQAVDVGTVIAVLAEEGEDVSKVAASAANGAAAPSAKPAAKPAADAEASSSSSSAAPAAAAAPARAPSAPVGDGERQRVSPVARRLAEEHGLDLAQLRGTGPSGRIIKRDVLAAIETASETRAAVPPSALARAEAPSVAQPLAVARGGGRKIALSNIRQTIARRLVESKQTIPHYQVSMTFRMDPLLSLRGELNDRLADLGIKLSVNDFLVRCCALAMAKHPEFNASWGGDHVLVHDEVNVGIAISLPAERGGGLVVGVVRDADRKSLRAISEESKALAEKARTRGLAIDEMEGSTFTISNLGMFGVDHFTAIINPPNAAILAVGAAIRRPIVVGDAIEIGHEMTVTLSNDHRIIDGAMAAAYLKTLKDYVENPAIVLV